MDVPLPDTSFDARVHDVLWRLTPASLYRRLRTWRPVRVAGRTLRIPMLGGQEVPAGSLNQRWRRELLGNVMPGPGGEGGSVIDVGAGLGEMLIDLQCSAPAFRYVGFEPSRVEYISELIRLNAIVGAEVVPASFSTERGLLAPRPVRLVNIVAGGAEADVLAGMRATLAADRPLLLCEVRFAKSERDREEERARKEALQAVLAEQYYAILQLVINVNGDIVGGARMPEFPLAVESAANRLQRDYFMVPLEQLDGLKRHLY